jgi:hypothetical protein
LRRFIDPEGHLFFTVFIDEAQTEPFRDLLEDDPLKVAYYSGRHVRDLVERSGWSIRSLHPPEPHIQHHLVCVPARAPAL